MLTLDINELSEISRKPMLYTPGEKLFWNDPYISKQMLTSHLDLDNNGASYKGEDIDKIVEFAMKHIDLKKGARILDAGCGPGLYCERFAKAGFQVTGIDYSENSIRYARKSAQENGLNITYINNNYLNIDFKNNFDAAFIISQDFCVLSHADRVKFLTNINKALNPGGFFVFDASTPESEKDIQKFCWYTGEDGFWTAEPHLVLEKRFYYPEETTYLYQAAVFTEDRTKVYRIYQTHYTKETVSELLMSNGFGMPDIFEDLTGRRYVDGSKTLGVFCQKIEGK